MTEAVGAIGTVIVMLGIVARSRPLAVIGIVVLTMAIVSVVTQ